MKVKSLSRVRPLATPWTAAHQAPPSMGFSRQESGLLQKGNVYIYWASLVSQKVKNLPTMRETWALSLGWEDPLEKEMATHSSTLAWKIPWMEEPDRLQSIGSQRVGHT